MKEHKKKDIQNLAATYNAKLQELKTLKEDVKNLKVKGGQ